MAVLHVRVTSAIAGTELLPWTPFPCVDFGTHVLAALGSRPSRPVILFHGGEPVDNDFAVAADTQVELTATTGDALTAEDREELLQKLRDARGQAGPLVFQAFSGGARDDMVVVLAAVRICGSALEFASELCKDDKEIVLCAVQHWMPPQFGGAIQFASERCKSDEEIVLAAVRHSPPAFTHTSVRTNASLETACSGDVRAVCWALPHQKAIVLAQVKRCVRVVEWLPDWARQAHDKEIVLAAMQQDGLALQWAEWASGDKEVVLAAVKQNGRALEFAGDRFLHDKEIVLASVSDDGDALEYASEALKNDTQIVLAAARQRALALQFASEAEMPGP